MSGETGAWVEVWGSDGWDEWDWFEDVRDAVKEARRISGRVSARVVAVNYAVDGISEFADGTEVGCAI